MQIANRKTMQPRIARTVVDNNVQTVTLRQCVQNLGVSRTMRYRRCPVQVASAMQEVATVTEETATQTLTKAGGITELNVNTFYPFLEEANDTLVVVDFYTDWCGPCKVIYPELVKLSAAYDGKVLFSKVNCNKNNKELGVKLQIKVAPTFHLYRQSQKVAEMTGAKVDKLKALIEQNV